MKKMITVSLLTLALNATAGWGGNNSPWGNNGFSNGPWGGSNNNNGIFGSTPYSMFTPDWFSEEMDDMMDEFDSNNSGPWGNSTPWNNSNFGNSPWGNKGFSNGPWSNKGFSNNPWGNKGFSNGPWGNSTPWSNYGYNKPISATAETGAK
jgi:hypothetical protein